jgi:nitroimidazol reductase NimA-like FMN-containing flavoprotein (pyridoxamine 5'-phosphate oxidase superfamily)
MESEGVTELPPHVCWDLLRSVEVGRLAVILAERPEIFPVNYLVDHGTIVFRTADGSKLSGSVREAPVAFEIDGYDSESGEAWSVVVKGRSGEIRELHELIDTAQLPLSPWSGAPKHRFVRIVPEELTGRRFKVVSGGAWESLLTGVRPVTLE